MFFQYLRLKNPENSKGISNNINRMRLTLLTILIVIQIFCIFSKNTNSKSNYLAQNSLNISETYENLIESAWILYGCDSLSLANETNNEIWTTIMSEMATAASSFFTLGNYSLDYKLEYLFAENSTNYEISAFFELVPWLLYTIISFILLIVIIFCLVCCQVFCIKKYRLFARCCMIDLNSSNISAKEKCGLFSCILICGVLMVMIIALMFLNNDIFQGYNEFQCISFNLAIEIYNPYPTDSNWLGTVQAIEKLDNASRVYLELVNSTELESFITLNTSSIISSYNTTVEEFEKNLSIYTNRSLYNPNPFSNQETPNISSDFLLLWGPSQEPNTYLYYLKQELAERLNYLIEINKAIDNVTTLLNQSSNLSDILLVKEADFVNLGNNFGEMFSLLLAFFNENESNVEQIFNLIVGMLALNVLPLFLGFCGFIMVGFCKWRVCNCCLHTAWILNCIVILILFGFIVVAYFYSSLAVWGCEIFDASLSSDELFTEIGESLQLNSSLINVMNFCLFDTSSNLVNYYSFGASLALPDTLYQTYTNFTNSNLSTINLDADIALLDYYYANYELFAGTTTNTQDSPTEVMEQLNLWSNYDSIGSYQELYGLCEVTIDQYVFSSYQCIYDEIYEPWESETFYLGQAICISLTNTSDNFALNRYEDESFSTCSNNITYFGTVPHALKTYYINLYLYKNTTENLISEMLASLYAYKGNLSNFDAQVIQLINVTKTDLQGLETLFNLTSNNYTKGLNRALNCSFLKTGFLEMKNSLCITSLDGIFYLVITLFSLFFLQIFLVCMNCWASIRALPKEYDLDDDGKVLIEKNSSIEMRRHSILY